MTVRSEHSSGTPGTTLETLTNPASIDGEDIAGRLTSEDAATFAAPSGTTLAAETTYFVVAEFDQTRRMWGFSEGEEESGGATGWSIQDVHRIYNGTNWGTPGDDPYSIRVNGDVAGDANTVPTAADGTVTTVENTAYTFDAGDFNFMDTDTGDTLEKVKIVTLPDAGMLALSGTTVTVNQEVTKAEIDADNLTFTPVTDATGSPYTTFTFKVNDGDDESASAYTMSVNVTAASCAAPTYAGDLRQIWTGALTVGSFEVSGRTFYGYNSTTNPVTGALSDTAFMVGTTEHTVESVSVGILQSQVLLAFKFTAATDPATSVVNKLVLYACDEGFAMGGFNPGGAGGYTLADTGLDWSSETSLNLYMAIDDTAPELLTAEVAGLTLVLTYDEALDEDNGVPASAFAVTVAGGTATAPASVAVDGAKVTLTLGSAVTVGQTVTLTYTKETGVPRVRDVFTNEAAALTNQAVANNSAPVFAVSTVARSFAENTAANVNIGAVIPEATDADTDAMLTYSMEGTDAASFNFNETTRQISTRPGVTYSFEQNPSYSVTIRVSDGI